MADCTICMAVCIEDSDEGFKLKKVIGLNLNVHRYTVIRYHFALKISKDILKMSFHISHRAIKILANEQSINYGP